jgi:F0F1-type ATP synthase assembly protein I
VPVNILIGVLALFVALALYSWGAWGAFRAGTFAKKHVTLVAAGLVFDVLATAMMAVQAGGLVNDLHTYLALIGFFGMMVVAIVGAWALAKARTSVLAPLSRWALLPYAVWLVVFVWGMIERGAARMS